MNEIMTPSEMTDKQIGKAVANYRAMLEKFAPQFAVGPVQQVLGSHEHSKQQAELFRVHVEAVSNLIVRKVTVNPNRTSQEALDATQRKQYTERKVVDRMPRGSGGEVEVVFFKPDLSEHDGYISDDDLEKEFGLRGLKPADLVSVAAVNEADPAFADEKPHGTHWKDENGKWCCAAFDRWYDERKVSVDQSDDDGDWGEDWWFAGVRK